MKTKLIRPTAEEEAAINVGIAADADTYVMTDKEFAGLRRLGRPPLAQTKVFTAIRLDADVLAGFKAGGKGWQTRINTVLKDWLKTHPQT